MRCPIDIAFKSDHEFAELLIVTNLTAREKAPVALRKSGNRSRGSELNNFSGVAEIKICPGTARFSADIKAAPIHRW